MTAVTEKTYDRTVYQAPHDGPIYLTTGQTLERVRVIRGGALYGRVLFATHSPCVEVPAGSHSVTVRDCRFEML